MDDLARWYSAQLDEDERIARAATPGPWRYDPAKHWRKPGTSWFEEGVFAGPAGKEAICVAGTGETDDPPSMADAAHIAAHDPTRVLREIDADRALVDAYAESWQACADIANAGFRAPDGSSLTEQWREHDTIVQTLKPHVLRRAAVYADRPGYREEWRP